MLESIPTEAKYARPINRTVIAPIQKPEKLPETIPERIVKDEPPSFEATTTSFVCFAFGDVNTFVASGIPSTSIGLDFHNEILNDYYICSCVLVQWTLYKNLCC